MLRRLTRSLVGPLFLLALAQPAFASEVLEGDGFSLRIPPGFRALPPEDCGG